MRLFWSEVRRVASRRLVRVTVLLAVVGIAVGGVMAFVFSDSLSEHAYQQRVQEAKVQARAQEAQIDACLRANGVARGEGDKVSDDVARRCFTDTPHADDPRFRRVRLRGVLQGVSGVLAVVGWALGASLVGAEFGSRGMTTLLTWESRRTRVFVAKSAAALVSLAVLALGILLLVTLAMAPSLALHGAPIRPNDPTWADLAELVGRGVLLTAIAGGIGLGLATIGRNTAAALGAGFAYILVLENILGSSIARWRRWLLLGNVIVLVSGENGGGDVPGRSVAGSAAFLTAVALALLVVAAASFRLRDLA